MQLWSRRFFNTTLAASAAAIAMKPLQAWGETDDFAWLEEVESDRALTWVRQRNAKSQDLLQGRPEFVPTRDRLLALLNSKDKIPYIQRLGNFFYNLWTDANHQRGLWRRTTMESYKTASPVWETVLDIDALGKQEQQSWVWKGVRALGPEYQRCLVLLSPGGSDASVVREFDLITKTFVSDGFTLPAAKSIVAWLDKDTLYVGTDFGPGSLTNSGYPRIIKEWRRGQPLSQAITIYSGNVQDVSVTAWATYLWEDNPQTGQRERHRRMMISRGLDFYRSDLFIVGAQGIISIAKPSDAFLDVEDHHVLISLRSDWTVQGKIYAAGSLLLTNYHSYLKGDRQFEVLFRPTATTALIDYSVYPGHVVLNILDQVKSRLVDCQYIDYHINPRWVQRSINTPTNGTIGITSLYDSTVGGQDPWANHYLMTYKNFVTPDSLYLAQIDTLLPHELLKQLPQRFDATGMTVEQQFATSKDGTKIPYFIIKPANFQANGRNPTLLYGYGGFQVSQQPWYSGSWGSNWLTKGGVLVVANIRGGGEFGPSWHQAAILQHKQRSYDDFMAIAEHLIQRRITQPRHLGIMGGSNGGLLVGAVVVQRPELFGAVVCQVPLLDMRRYHKLLAGNSWMAEYGNPDDPQAWNYIQKYSPYHNVRRGRSYPRVFFTTSTKDDRVHPAHARKMVAKMESQGHDVIYYENIEGGHGGAADNNQRATLMALEFAYLWMQLG